VNEKLLRVQNCWEYMGIGREPGGGEVDDQGICSAATAEMFDGVNHGKNAGRCCWIVAGTSCKEGVQGTLAQRLRDCLTCPFFLQVEEQEGTRLILTEGDLSR